MLPESITGAIKQYIKEGMQYLSESQLPYGEFRTMISPIPHLAGHRQYISSIYVTTFVLYAVHCIEDKQREEIIRKGIKFLLEEMEPPGIWRFTTSNRSAILSGGKLQIITPLSILPDLDDTACSSFSLKQNNALPETGFNLPQFLTNRNDQGLFYTWLMDAPPYRKNCKGLRQMPVDGNDICPGVGCNILLYLGDIKETAALSNYLVELAISKRNVDGSRYFSNKYVFFYLYSRAFYNGATSLARGRDAILEQIIPYQNIDGSFGSTLETALAACTLMNFGYNLKEVVQAIKHICKTRGNDCSWPIDSFFVEPYAGSHYGSSELTTAICLEALFRFLVSQ